MVTLKLNEKDALLVCGLPKEDVEKAMHTAEFLCVPAEDFGASIFYSLPHQRGNKMLQGLQGWLTCTCGACNCTNPASTTDNLSRPLCELCFLRRKNWDGNTICSKCEGFEEEREVNQK
ncbi:MAG: hypothetical protein KGL39_49390 [Patescibacteria group bacterium]|nr:hypothetical protein [Patescibacteria group bacterium]